MARLRGFSKNSAVSNEPKPAAEAKVTTFTMQPELEPIAQRQDCTFGEEAVEENVAIESESQKVEKESDNQKPQNEDENYKPQNEGENQKPQNENESQVIKNNANIGGKMQVQDKVDKSVDIGELYISYQERDIQPKYTDTQAAISSIKEGGEFYEDYKKACENGLCSDKEFVLSVLSQSPDRFYSPLTPHPHEWLDEQFLSVCTSIFYDEQKESICPASTSTFGEMLYVYYKKYAFSTEFSGMLTQIFKRVLGIKLAQDKTVYSTERTAQGVENFVQQVQQALGMVQQKFEQAKKEREADLQKLSQSKAAINEQIQAIKI